MKYRWVSGLLMTVALAACNGGADLQDAPVPLGDFKLGHNIVIASKAFQGPLSREASEEMLSETVKAAIAERFDRYDGDRLYHFGISVEGYVLAIPGVPVVAAPKSILIINLTVWDDAAGKKLNEEPHQITVFENFGADMVLGSGFTMSAEEQLEILARNAAKEVERYLVAQQKAQGWFTPDPATASAEATTDSAAVPATDAEAPAL